MFIENHLRMNTVVTVNFIPNNTGSNSLYGSSWVVKLTVGDVRWGETVINEDTVGFCHF